MRENEQRTVESNQKKRIGLALSGGGSRAIAFHLGCLRALHQLGVLEKIDVLSTISGGSVIGAYYAYTPHKSFDEFETGIKTILRDGFHSRILIELAKPLNLCRCLKSGVLAQLQDAVALLTKYELSFPRTTSRTDMLHRVLVRDVFPGINMDSPRRNNVDVIIGACELRTGTAFRFGSK